MPHVVDDGERMLHTGVAEERIQIAVTIGPHQNAPGHEVLHSETIGIKLNST